MSTASDVKEGARTQWALTAELVAEIPLASLYSGGLPGAPVPPYAQFVWEVEGKEFSSSTDGTAPYLERGRLVVRVWAAGTDDEAAEDAVGEIAALVEAALAVTEWALPAGMLLHVFPGDTVHAEDGTYQGEPVWRADVGIGLLIQRTPGDVTHTLLVGYFPAGYF